MNITGMESLVLSFCLVLARVGDLRLLSCFPSVAPVIFGNVLVLLSAALFVSMPAVALPEAVLPAVVMNFLNGVFLGLLVHWPCCGRSWQ